MERPAGDAIKLCVKAEDTIEVLKQKIMHETDILVRRQRLRFNGTELKNGKSLSDYNIKDSSILYMVYSLGFQICLKTVSGKIITLEVENVDTVKNVKEIIRDKEGKAMLDWMYEVLRSCSFTTEMHKETEIFSE